MGRHVYLVLRHSYIKQSAVLVSYFGSTEIWKSRVNFFFFFCHEDVANRLLKWIDLVENSVGGRLKVWDAKRTLQSVTSEVKCKLLKEKYPGFVDLF
jgi:hypothetical protein